MDCSPIRISLYAKIEWGYYLFYIEIYHFAPPQDLIGLNGSCGGSGGGWSAGDSHDSGIGSSPPFDTIRGLNGCNGGSMMGPNIISNGIGNDNIIYV